MMRSLSSLRCLAPLAPVALPPTDGDVGLTTPADLSCRMRILTRQIACGAAVACTAAAPVRAQTFHFVYPAPPPGKVIRTVDSTAPRLDVYRLAHGAPDRSPALIFFFNRGDSALDAFYEDWARTAAAKGIVAITPTLRFGHAAEDFKTTLAHLGDHADRYGIDRHAIAVYAASANVFTAFPIVEDSAQTTIQAAVMLYGTSPVTHFRRDVPILYVRAGLDRPTGNGTGPATIIGLSTLAIAQNAPMTFFNDPSGHHGFEGVDDDAATRDAIDFIVDWVKRATSASYLAALRHGIPEATAAAEVVTGDFSAAAAAYASLVRGRPNDARLALAYGEALLGNHQYGEACAELAHLKNKGLGPRDLGIPAARACAQSGDADAAIAWLQSIPSQYLPREIADDSAFTALRARADFRALFQPRS